METSWAIKLADSIIARTPKLYANRGYEGKWSYDYGVVLKGFQALWERTGKNEYYQFIQDNMDHFIQEDGSIRGYHLDEYNIDHINNGKLLFMLYENTGLEKYKLAASRLRKQLETHPRTSEGAFWHKKIYPYQIWLDGLYMGSPFYLEYILNFEDGQGIDDVTKQFILCEKHTKDAETGLLFHAWDEQKVQPWCNSETGCSPNFWGRSLGWYVMALVDVLELLPEEHQDFKELVRILEDTLSALKKYQDAKSGVWYQVVNQGERKGNYLEASASSMITYAIAKGIRLGLLDDAWERTLDTAYQGLIKEFVLETKEGWVNLNKNCMVAGLGGADQRDGSFAYYISEPIICNDQKGVGAFLQACVEYENLHARRERYMQVFNIVQFGAVSDGATLCTEAIAKAISAAEAVGGGTVFVPSGTFHTGAIILKSNIELHLSPGAILSFSTDPAHYPVVTSRWEGVKREVHASCIYGEDLVNVSITGHGMLEGNGQPWWDKQRNSPQNLAYPRPKMISLDRCKRITIKDISLRNSPSWTVNPIACSDITIDNISILNPADSPNTDGIDPESCNNVRISNCHIDVGDDCIAIKAGTEDTAQRQACENITITNCTMVHGHGGVVLGSEMSGDIRNVTISNCIFKQTDRGIRLKSRRGRGGIVEDIRVSNIVMEEVISPFILNLYYFCGPRGKEKYVWDKNPYPVTEETPCFRRIHFSHITARNVHAAAGFIYGLAEQYITEITFTDIDISMAENAVPGRPAMMTGIQDMNNRGFFLGNVKDIRFNRVTIENHEGPAFYLENGENVEVLNCESRGTRQPEELFEQVTVPYDELNPVEEIK